MENEEWPRNQCTMDLGRIKLVHPAMLFEHEVAVIHKMAEIATDCLLIEDNVADSGLFRELVE